MSKLPAMAARNVGRNRRRSAITGLAILFGVTSVLILRGFIEGVQNLMTADVVEGRAGALQIHRKGFLDSREASPTGLNMPYDDKLLARILAVPNVRAATGRVQFQGLVSNGLTQTMVVARGVELEREKEVCSLSDTTVMEGGRNLKAGDDKLGLIGFELGETFGVKPGKTVTVQTSSPGGRSNAVDVQVVGLTTSNFPFENKRVMTLPLKSAQALVGLEGRVTEIAVAVKNLRQLDETVAALQRELGPDYEVHGWPTLQPFVRDVINRQALVLGIISTVLAIIVITGIINTMLMSVFERVREIGTLLAVGVRRRQVMGLFILEGALLGLLGGAVGAALATTVLALISLKGIPLQLASTSAKAMLRPGAGPEWVAGAVLIAVVGAVLASAWPAFRASRLNPVDALRNA
jgi:putative ABC transport system permease protein